MRLVLALYDEPRGGQRGALVTEERVAHGGHSEQHRLGGPESMEEAK